MFGLTLLGNPDPVAADALATVAKLPPDYLQLITSWGPGRARGHLDFLDPRDPGGEFAIAQERFRLHAPHMIAVGTWSTLQPIDAEDGAVIGRYRNGAILVASPRAGLVSLAPRGNGQWSTSLDELFRHHLRVPGPPPLPDTYSTQPAPRAELFAALAAGDEPLADQLLAAIAETAGAWTVLEVAHDLAFDASTIAMPLRAAYFAQCVRYAKRSDGDRLEPLPVRAIAEALAAGSLSPDHLAQVRACAYIESPISGAYDAIERELTAQIRVNPRDRHACSVLADHLEARGQLLRAALVREQSESLPLAEVLERGLVARSSVDAEAELAAWITAWHSDDPDAPIEPVVAAAMALQKQHRKAIVAWLAARENAKLAADADAFPILVLALRSPYVDVSREVIVEIKATAAMPWLLRAIRRGTRDRWGGDDREPLAVAHTELGKLTAAQVTELLAWLDDDDARLRAPALCLLQKHGKDDRVFLAALAHFTDGHPYSERVIARRKTDPRVLPALLAHFARAERASLRDGKHVAYTIEYRILSRYLARLGNERGRGAWERCKQMGRIDRAAQDREARRDGM
ncbi:MAG: hypothetical protein ABI867_23320 [Kofleriaceae bacterium]